MVNRPLVERLSFVGQRTRRVWRFLPVGRRGRTTPDRRETIRQVEGDR